MKLFFIIATLLLLLYEFETIKILFFEDAHQVLVWIYDVDKTLLCIFPQKQYIFIDSDRFYFYLDNDTDDDYVNSISLDSENNIMKQQVVVNFKHLISWSRNVPQIKTYPASLKNLTDILNYLGNN